MNNIDILIPTIIALAGILYSVHCFKSEMRIKLFADYTKRYQEIMLNLPPSTWTDDIDINDLPEGERSLAIKYYRAYFDLCSEEYFLWNNNQIDDRTWHEWRNGMQYSFSRKPVITAWRTILVNSSYSTKFSKFVEDLLVTE